MERLTSKLLQTAVGPQQTDASSAKEKWNPLTHVLLHCNLLLLYSKFLGFFLYQIRGFCKVDIASLLETKHTKVWKAATIEFLRLHREREVEEHLKYGVNDFHSLESSFVIHLLFGLRFQLQKELCLYSILKVGENLNKGENLFFLSFFSYAFSLPLYTSCYLIL